MKCFCSRILNRLLGRAGIDYDPAARVQQLLLMDTYSRSIQNGKPPSFEEIGFDCFSETYEDGILLYIFAAIGMKSRRCVDIGAAGIERSNTANLIVNHGFSALLVDAQDALVESACKYYGAHPATRLFPPQVVNSFVTVDNVNSIIEDNGYSGDLDLLCIDLDGNDYWIWKAIGADARVVCVEYQDILGPDRAWTIPYKVDFDRHDYEANKDRVNYGGASLRAFTKLAKEKGYRLVGCNRGGWNAFFVKNELASDTLPEVSVESCFTHSWNKYGAEERFPLVKDLPWEEV